MVETKTYRSRRRRTAHTKATRGRTSGWRKDPAGRRERMLDAATRLLAERGYDGLRTRDVAQAAAVSEGTVFHHFGSKQGLLQTIAARYAHGFVEAMFREAERGEPDRDVDATIRRAFAYVRHHQPPFGLFLLADGSAATESARAAHRDAIVENLTRIFAGWQERGLVRPIEPRITAELCFGLVETALRECFVRASGANEELYVGEVVRAIAAMLQRSPEPVP